MPPAVPLDHRAIGELRNESHTHDVLDYDGGVDAVLYS